MNSVIKIFNYRFYLKEFAILFVSYLLMEQIFSWLFIPSSAFVQPFQKISGFVIYGIMLYMLPKFNRAEKIYICIFTLLLLRLVIESLFKYNTFFQQLTMFYVLFPVMYTIFIKYICRVYDLDLLEFIAKFYLAIYLVFMALYGRGFSFSLEGLDLQDLGVFSGDGRIIHATSVFMMIIPLLWYLNRFIHTKKIVHLLLLILCVTIILIHQHRSVWSCAIFSLLIYFALSMRVNKNAIPKIWGVLIGAVIVIAFAYFFMSAMFPELVDFLGTRFNDIFDPAKQESTGRFRVEQRETYFRLFLQRPVFGWTFEGFEMPNPLVDWWPEKTGQHFHEGFMEVLFYHGVVGFVFKYSFLFYIAFRAFSRKITDQTVVLIAFCLSGFLFSLSYVPQTVFWGHVGLCLYYLEKDDLQNEEASLEEDGQESYANEEQLAEPAFES